MLKVRELGDYLGFLKRQIHCFQFSGLMVP
jgi:hypothetical protein